jgi:hypothetical protein
MHPMRLASVGLLFHAETNKKQEWVLTLNPPKLLLAALAVAVDSVVVMIMVESAVEEPSALGMAMRLVWGCSLRTHSTAAAATAVQQQHPQQQQQQR